MKLDSKYFSFCDKIGVMKENHSQQNALNTLINKIKSSKAADPKFKEIVSKLTLSSPEVYVRACVLYHYDIDVDYVVNGNIKSGKISDFGASGVPDSLHLTEYSGDGNYTVLKDVSNVPYPVWNDNNLFTLEEMKKALGKVIEGKLPRGATSYQSKNWSVAAFFVPVLVARINYNKKDYRLYYNLQNGYYHWEYAENPALLKRGASTKRLVSALDALAIVLSAVGVILGFNQDPIFPGLLIPVAILIVNILLVKKLKRTKRWYQNVFLKNPDQKPARYIISAALKIVIALFGVIAML